MFNLQKTFHFLACGVLVSIFSGCAGDGYTSAPNRSNANSVGSGIGGTLVSSSRLKTLANGLQYKVIEKGSGDVPKVNDTVTVKFRGTLADGTVFDEARSPVQFRVDQVIPGMQQALILMNEGSVWEVIVPPNLAYGARGTETIKPNSTLYFSLELLNVKHLQDSTTY